MAIPYRIGITGHRNLGDEAMVAFVAEQVAHILERAEAKYNGQLVALSALAEGADQLFAEAALTRGILLEVVIPFANYADDFSPGPTCAHYEWLLSCAKIVHHLPYTERSDEAYLAGGQWIVEHSDLLVAVWNGRPAAGKGGTGDVVRFAQRVARQCIYVNPLDYTVTGDRMLNLHSEKEH